MWLLSKNIAMKITIRKGEIKCQKTEDVDVVSEMTAFGLLLFLFKYAAVAVVAEVDAAKISNNRQKSILHFL